jgi:MFS family permease
MAVMRAAGLVTHRGGGAISHQLLRQKSQAASRTKCGRSEHAAQGAEEVPEMAGGSLDSRHAGLSVIAIAVVATLGLLYIVSQFLRNSVGVIAPDLAAEMGLSPIEIGLLSSIYFLVFAATQLPLGVALDRFGPRACMLFSIAVTAVGSMAFALSSDVGGLVVSRALLGFGTACFLMAPVALYARWFPPERFSTMAGIHLGVGSLGALLATAPLAVSAAAFGWRSVFVAVAGISVVIGLLTWLLASDDPPGKTTERRHETLKEAVAGIWQVIRTPSMGRIFLVQLTSYPSYVLVIGLWGGPYLAHVYGHDLEARGDILFVAALAQVIGAFFWGPSDRIFGRFKPPILFGTALSFLALVIFAAAGRMPLPLLLFAFALLGFSTGMTSVVMSHGRSLVPPHLLGRCITLLNIGTMGGGFLVQFVSGAVIGLFGSDDGKYPLEAYQTVFCLQALLVLVGAWAYFGSRENGLDK